MAKWAYLLFNAAVASSMVFAVWWVPAFWRQWRSAVRALLLVSIPFIVWDMLAAHAGHWFFNPTYTLAGRLYGLPIEEVLFFVTVPLACMVVWVLLARMAQPNAAVAPRYVVKAVLYGVAAALVLLAAISEGRTYTRLALLAAAGTCLVLLWRVQLAVTKRFVLFQACSFGLFMLCNTLLTALPIITYGAAAVTGWRVGTIPVEDFLYNFALVNLFLVAYEFRSTEQSKTV